MKAFLLLSAIGEIDEALIEEAEGPAPKRRGPFQAALLCACLVLAVGLGVGLVFISTVQFSGGSGTLPGDDVVSQPCILHDGERYLWGGMHWGHDLPQDQAYLKGLTYLGPLSGVTTGEPTEELQLQAGFEAEGEVYTDPDRPLILLARLTTDWLEEEYVVFMQPVLNQSLLFYGGTLYCIEDRGSLSPLDAMPEGYVLAGTLGRKDPYSLPSEDLQTSGSIYAYGGSWLYVNPGAPETVYVSYTTHHQGGESKVRYLPAHVWAPE